MLKRKFMPSPLANQWIIWALALPMSVALAVFLTSGQATAQVGGDAVAPVVTAPVNITVYAKEASGTTGVNPAIAVFLAAATAVDVVDGTLPVSNNAPTVFPPGNTIVTFSATDAGGNTGSAQATVTVLGRRDFFGTVVSVAEDLLVIETKSGTVNVPISEETRARLPGKRMPTSWTLPWGTWWLYPSKKWTANWLRKRSI